MPHQKNTKATKENTASKSISGGDSKPLSKPKPAPTVIASRRAVHVLGQRDLVRLKRSQKLLKEDIFACPYGREAMVQGSDNAFVAGCFVSNPKPQDIVMLSTPPYVVVDSAAPPSTAPTATAVAPPQVFVRVHLGGQAEQILPLEVMRREHPQLLIDYLLSTAHLI